MVSARCGPGTEERTKKKREKKKKRWAQPKWWQVEGLLVGGVDVLGLGHASQLVLVARQAAEEDSAADAQDGGAPAEAVRPGVVVVALEDHLVELDRIDDQRDDLQHHCGPERERERDRGRKGGKVENTAGQTL